jgi:hypothetical protein
VTFRTVTAWTLAVPIALVFATPPPAGQGHKARRTSGAVQAAVIEATQAEQTLAPAAPPGGSGFSPQVRLGFTSGDQWEPAIAADDHGNVYVLYPQYLGTPGCPDCPSPTMILQISRARGTTWGAPRQIATPGSGQWDAQIVVDPVDGRTVYAAWLQNGKSDTVVARSADLGETWSVVVADSTNAGTDKPALAVRGNDVYVGFNHSQKVWVASSHDGGQTFSASNVNPNGKLGWSLAGGASVAPDGRIYFGWAGYEQNGGAKGKVNLYVSVSADGGATWTNRLVDVSAAPPVCSDYLCGWAYLGAQVTLDTDDGVVVYALWNAGSVAKGPERIYFARSLDGGATWSARQDVSAAPVGAAHAFPAVAARGAGDVRIAWMDARTANLWNVYYRSSSNGGQSFSAESDLSTHVPGFSYIQPGGFSFPFGDYFELDLDDQGTTHAVFGEGLNYDSPGSIWYVRGR